MITKQIMEPSLPDVLFQQKIEIFKSFKAHAIGQIQSFDAATQTASISVVYKKVKSEDPNGVKTLTEYPLLMKVPCLIISGGKGSLEMPISKDDFAMVFFNDEDIDNWFIGQVGSAPNTSRRHDISDGIALVGLFNLNTSLDDYLTDRVRLKYDNVKIEMLTDKLEMTFSKIKLSNGTDDLIALLNQFIDAVVAMTVGGLPPANLATFISIQGKMSAFKE